MITAVVVLSISSSLGWFGALWAVNRWREAVAEADRQRLIAAQETANASTVRAEARLIEQARQRSQDVVALAQKEVTALIGELASCNDPDVVRGRLERLFSTGKRASDRDQPAADGTVALRANPPTGGA
jgi:hypothetical protein